MAVAEADDGEDSSSCAMAAAKADGAEGSNLRYVGTRALGFNETDGKPILAMVYLDETSDLIGSPKKNAIRIS